MGSSESKSENAKGGSGEPDERSKPHATNSEKKHPQPSAFVLSYVDKSKVKQQLTSHDMPNTLWPPKEIIQTQDKPPEVKEKTPPPEIKEKSPPPLLLPGNPPSGSQPIVAKNEISKSTPIPTTKVSPSLPIIAAPPQSQAPGPNEPSTSNRSMVKEVTKQSPPPPPPVVHKKTQKPQKLQSEQSEKKPQNVRAPRTAQLYQNVDHKPTKHKLPQPTATSIDNASEKSFRLCAAASLTPNAVESLLKCPACCEPAYPPIFTCASGHIICAGCRASVPSCPQCGRGFTEARNILAEQLAQNFAYKCRFQDQGCSDKIKGEEIRQHAEVCNFRPIQCKIFPCKSPMSRFKEINFGEFVQHLETTHNAGGAPVGRPQWRREVSLKKLDRLMHRGRRVPFLLECFGDTFLQCIESDGDQIWLWVAILGSDEHAARYFVTLTMQSGKKDDKLQLKSQWKGPVHPIRLSSADVLASGFCMVTSEPCLKSFLHPLTTATEAPGETAVNFPKYNFQIAIKKVARSRVPATEIASDKN